MLFFCFWSRLGRHRRRRNPACSVTWAINNLAVSLGPPLIENKKRSPQWGLTLKPSFFATSWPQARDVFRVQSTFWTFWRSGGGATVWPLQVDQKTGWYHCAGGQTKHDFSRWRGPRQRCLSNRRGVPWQGQPGGGAYIDTVIQYRNGTVGLFVKGSSEYISHSYNQPKHRNQIKRVMLLPLLALNVHGWASR